MPITRLYDAAAEAEAAVTDLKAIGFTNVSVHVIDNKAGYVSANTIRKYGVVRSRAEVYAEQIRAGATLIAVDAPLGTAGDVTRILAAKRDGETSAHPAHYEGFEWDEAAPVSSAFRIPVLISGAAVFSKFWGLQVLKKSSGPWTKSFGFPLLLNSSQSVTPYKAADWKDAAPFSTAIKIPVLSDNAAPLSKFINMPVLKSPPAGWAKSHGLPLLSDKPAILSSALGLAVLAKNPAPLSSLFNMPVLSKGAED